MIPMSNSWLDSVSFNKDGLIPAIAQDHDSNRVLMVAWMNREALQLTAKTKTAVYFSRSRQKLWHKGETSGHTQIVHDIRLDCDADVIVLKVTQIGGIACHTGRESCFYQRLDLSGETPTWQTVDPVLKDPEEIYHAQDNQDPAISTAPKKSITNQASILQQLDAVLRERKHADADSSYVASLYARGLNKILEKVGEETVEAIIAAKDLAQCQNNASDQKAEIDADKNTDKNAFDKARHDLIYEVADVWFHSLVGLAWFDIASDDVVNELGRRFGLSGLEEKASRSA